MTWRRNDEGIYHFFVKTVVLFFFFLAHFAKAYFGVIRSEFGFGSYIGHGKIQFVHQRKCATRLLDDDEPKGGGGQVVFLSNNTDRGRLMSSAQNQIQSSLSSEETCALVHIS